MTEETHGNACGIGVAEFCTTRLLRSIDHELTRSNLLTSGRLAVGMLPLDYASDLEIFEHALPTIGLREPHEARILWIRNTLDLAEVECSLAYLELAERRSDLQVVAPPRDWPWGSDGNLPPSMAHWR